MAHRVLFKWAISRTYVGVIFKLAVLTFTGHAVADTFVIGTPGEIAAAELGASVGDAVAAGMELANTKAQANAQFGAARSRFFAEYPNGKNFEEANKEFAELLWEKDLYFLSISLPTGFGDKSPNSMASVFAKLDVLTGGTLDNGIPDSAGFEFSRWVTGVRQSLGAQSYRGSLPRMPSVNELAAALTANSDLSERYRKARDEAEFEMQCRAHPGAYCATPGSGTFSQEGNLTRAARIADYYLVNYANDLPGGSTTKAKVRDAIIKYEGLTYTPEDCIHYLDNELANDPRHDPNLTSFRRAIATYESAKVMSSEDICVRSAQDMQREEDARGGHFHMDPSPKIMWDTAFRTAKFNEVYGTVTNDQARELAQAFGRDAKYYQTRVAVIDFYTKANGVRPYSYVRATVVSSAEQ
jgi:hypothetical protein